MAENSTLAYGDCVTLSGCLLTTGAAGTAGVVGEVVPPPAVGALALPVESLLPPHPVNITDTIIAL